jgi:transposase
MVNLNEFQKHEIIVKYKMNIPVRQIAKEIKISKNTVQSYITKYKNTGNLNIKKGRGRKKKLSEDDEKMIINLMYNNKNWKIPELKLELEKLKINVSENTLINILKKYEFTYKKRKKKPVLTEIHKNIRMQFALMNISTDPFKIIYSDEITIVKDQYTDKFWVGKEDEGIICTFKHPIKRNVWGCISSGGTETIHIFKEIMNADKYISILKNNLLPIYNENYIFQHDNDPKHTAYKTSIFLIDNNIKVLLWPPNSPDLNPIENVWKLLKDKLKKCEITDINFDEKIIECWNSIKFEHVFNIISSINVRICNIIQMNGGHINY